MKIIKIQGGLGNQMFQYAFYKSLKNNCIDCYVDIKNYDTYKLHYGFELNRIFKNIDLSFARKYHKKEVLGKLFSIIPSKFIVKFNKNYILQKNFAFDKAYFEIDNCYLDGYWQSEKYFKKITKDIYDAFTFEPLDSINFEFLKNIQDYNLVSIHVRRGDYVNHPLHGGICDLEYYNKAISFIRSKVANVHFLVFSNDILWCKDNLKLDRVTYIDHNRWMDSYKDMHLMSLCKHNIIANSSFSWWGAWLNQNDDKIVIAPSKWFNDDKINQKDICPNSWVRI
ncbi:glycosyl transferase 11 family protein [Francisella philomiragia subsp. philomiragia ATCC 25015]|uniref:alpha-1,2-fucosyltransferase n=1 Tax=Francisella philomiragia TaxID=28110 RepID=UPI0001AF79BF|nr:alpha-1,2-fucosyltransferase [Francisella philomiragia]AJI74371.1 glycosyl transferase 11 family protein [Francisella philomiragia subsp. philomiragia ATCC 25015]EET21243.1 alpha-1,2-fucosyltransferase [Francisella philomiragia subsp. philomiragia ATCC 25015]MBK2238895.1 alpha-1,2-fucosyltransferase [Francisella philomiragia]